MSSRGDEALRKLERLTLAAPGAQVWASFAQELARRGRREDAYVAAGRAVELDRESQARQFLVAGWSGNVVPWAIGELRQPRKLAIDFAPVSAYEALDVGGGVIVFAHHPTAGPQDRPLAHEPL